VDDWRNGGFGLYVHWPFCQAKCPYCDFNSHVSARIDQRTWAEAYITELGRYATQVPDRVLNSIFFGGGTPSLMHPDTVAAVIETARKHWTFANDIEITLEANPGSVEAGRFAGYRDAGVNRISMGVQALNDPDLKRLGRIHSVVEAQQAFDVARACFDRVSFDLIYARQNQTPQQWRDELRQALSMAVDHLSLYQLTIEEGTAFGDRYSRGKLRGLPSDESAAEMYEITQEICDQMGFPAYEVSNHARPGAQSLHNLIYWSYGDYVGVGPGAHGRMTINGQKFATESELTPGRWLRDVAAGSGETARTLLTPQDMAEEYVIMGLRLVRGLDLTRYQNLNGSPFSKEKLSYLEDLDMITVDRSQLIVSPKGRAVLNAVINELLAE
jgi:oxygen-independent coproporphyrinogen-3 oxidase